MKKNQTVLHKNSKGIQIVREDYKNRSKVCVLGFNGTAIRTYRFNNVPEYKHPYLSWENLDHWGGWVADDTYLLSAVQNKKKPAAQYYYGYDSVPNIKSTKGVEVFIKYIYNWVFITRSCSLKDLFDVDSIIDAYDKQDVFLRKEELMPYMEKPLLDLLKENFFLNPKTGTETVITGLML